MIWINSQIWTTTEIAFNFSVFLAVRDEIVRWFEDQPGGFIAGGYVAHPYLARNEDVYEGDIDIWTPSGDVDGLVDHLHATFSWLKLDFEVEDAAVNQEGPVWTLSKTAAPYQGEGFPSKLRLECHDFRVETDCLDRTLSWKLCDLLRADDARDTVRRFSDSASQAWFGTDMEVRGTEEFWHTVRTGEVVAPASNSDFFYRAAYKCAKYPWLRWNDYDFVVSEGMFRRDGTALATLEGTKYAVVLSALDEEGVPRIFNSWRALYPALISRDIVVALRWRAGQTSMTATLWGMFTHGYHEIVKGEAAALDAPFGSLRMRIVNGMLHVDAYDFQDTEELEELHNDGSIVLHLLFYPEGTP